MSESINYEQLSAPTHQHHTTPTDLLAYCCGGFLFLTPALPVLSHLVDHFGRLYFFLALASLFILNNLNYKMARTLTGDAVRGAPRRGSLVGVRGGKPAAEPARQKFLNSN
ncbi:hypothetical protein A2783_03675 [Microgenomates group bacterium RIFCSPHIGHO2_01_FULL_45_11]|nr:MAG: hypothetical protein A2783_03675 [Microgenomates group bacterium RIFCSPHIGHO2_01_FULL_45_11]